MYYLNKLFKEKSLLGWGEPKSFEGTVQDISDAVDILSGQASLSIVLSRAEHNINNKNPMPYKEWLETIKEEDTYRGYMLRTYNMKDGEFVLDIPLKELDELANIMLTYLKVH